MMKLILNTIQLKNLKRTQLEKSQTKTHLKF